MEGDTEFLSTITNSDVADVGCIVCKIHLDVGSPAEVHHLRMGVGMGQRSSASRAIPLCPPHHRIGGYGVAFHAGKKAFEAKYGTEEWLLDKTHALIVARRDTRTMKRDDVIAAINRLDKPVGDKSLTG